MLFFAKSFRSGWPLAWLVFCAMPVSAQEADVAFFEKRIRPVLVEKCYQCHSAKAQAQGKLRGGLLLDTRMGIRKGGETGPAVVPNKVEASLLIDAIRHDSFEMPPKGKLADTAIADFVRWIEMGAPDPRDGTIVVEKDEIDLEAGRRFWSLLPLGPSSPPKMQNAEWPRSDIDRFVLAKLEAAGLSPNGDATPNTLIRRLYFDLIGLPPSPEELARWTENFAVERLVDHLLASPHFGERWGRHWLDVARYAENNGAPKKNSLWPDAIRYRKYILDAFAEDKPVDRFVLEQIAGDLLPADSEQQRRTQIIATGFLALGMKPDAGVRMDDIAEQTDVLGRAFLGLSVGCARCHDHKFDPIPTRDFYALAGIFFNSIPKDQNSSITRSRTLGEFDKKKASEYKTYLGKLGSLNNTINKSRARIVELLAKNGSQFDVLRSIEENLASLNANEKKKAEQAFAEWTKAEQTLEQLRKQGIPKAGLAVAVEETGYKRKFVNTKIHIRGSENNLGDEVPRGALQVLTTSPLQIGDDESGRLQFAKLVSEHPLTYRVMANRVWHHLFGRGIVRTVDNFGTLGDEPTHPALLEMLASQLAEHRSVKTLIREIVLSRTYQLSSTENTAALKADPDSALRWRHTPRRRDAEALRDAILSAAGTLERTPPDRWQQLSYHTTSNNLVAMASVRHRAVYLPVIRGMLSDLFAAFNFPPPDLVIGKRETPSVPTQALFLMNSPLVLEQSHHLAHRLMHEDNARNDRGRVERAYLLTLGRQPSKAEVDNALSLVAELDWAGLCQALFCCAEFRFVE